MCKFLKRVIINMKIVENCVIEIDICRSTNLSINKYISMHIYIYICQSDITKIVECSIIYEMRIDRYCIIIPEWHQLSLTKLSLYIRDYEIVVSKQVFYDDELS